MAQGACGGDEQRVSPIRQTNETAAEVGLTQLPGWSSGQGRYAVLTTKLKVAVSVRGVGLGSSTRLGSKTPSVALTPRA